MLIIDLVNVVARARIARVDVADMSCRVPCNYVPSRFAALVIPIKKSKMVHVNLYSCTITSTGANSTDDAISAIWDAVGIIEESGEYLKFLKPPSISSITAVVYPTDEKMIPIVPADAQKVPFFSSHCKIRDPLNNATLMIAKSGRVTVTGATSLHDVIAAAKRLFGI